MNLHVFDGSPDDERMAAVVAVAIQAYIDSEVVVRVVPMSRWTAAARREVQGVPVSLDSIPRGWRSHR